METGGTKSTEAADFVAQLAFARAQTAPPYLRRGTALALERRWMRLLGCSAAFAVAASLVYSKSDLATAQQEQSAQPWLADASISPRRQASS